MADTAINPSTGEIRITGYAPLIVQSYLTDGLPPLSVTTLPRLFPKQTVPLIDTRTGLMTNEWYRYFAAVLESATSGVNALDPVAVQEAIDSSRSSVAQLEALTAALDSMAVQNAASQAATVIAVQAIAAESAPASVATAAAIPPVQTFLDSAGGD